MNGYELLLESWDEPNFGRALELVRQGVQAEEFHIPNSLDMVPLLGATRFARKSFAQIDSCIAREETVEAAEIASTVLQMAHLMQFEHMMAAILGTRTMRETLAVVSRHSARWHPLALKHFVHLFDRILGLESVRCLLSGEPNAMRETTEPAFWAGSGHDPDPELPQGFDEAVAPELHDTVREALRFIELPESEWRTFAGQGLMATPIRSYLQALASLRTEVRLAKMCMEAELAQRRTGEYPATMNVWDPFNQSPFGYEVVDEGYRVWVNSGPNTIELDFGAD